MEQPPATALTRFAEDLGHEIDRAWPPVDEAFHSAWDELSPEQQEPWAEELWHTMWLEGIMPGAEWLADVPPEGADSLRNAVGDYHDTLPFSRAERRWFFGVYTQNAAQDASPPLAAVMKELGYKRAEIISLGKRETIDGHQLICRWWDWRRGVGEYEGMDTAMTSHHALINLEALTKRLIRPHGY